MTVNSNPSDPDQLNPSLKDVLKKRRTKTGQGTVAEKKRVSASPKTVTQNAPGHLSQPVGKNRTSTDAAGRGRQNITRSSASNLVSKRWFIGLGVTLLAVVVIGVGVITSTSNHPVYPVIVLTVPPQSGGGIYQAVGANRVVEQFKQVGLPISGERNIPVSSNDWKASQEILFDVQQNGETGSFIVLSYPDQKSADVGKVTGDPRFKDWQALTAGNVILLISPQTGSGLRAQIGSYLTQSLTAPDQSSVTGTPSSNKVM